MLVNFVLYPVVSSFAHANLFADFCKPIALPTTPPDEADTITPIGLLFSSIV